MEENIKITETKKKKNWFSSMFLNGDGWFSSCIFTQIIFSIVDVFAVCIFIFGRDPQPEYAFNIVKFNISIITACIIAQKIENVLILIKDKQVDLSRGDLVVKINSNKK